LGLFFIVVLGNLGEFFDGDIDSIAVLSFVVGEGDDFGVGFELCEAFVIQIVDDCDQSGLFAGFIIKISPVLEWGLDGERDIEGEGGREG